ncbi:WYL domain-containing protein [Streptomyces sp. NPDC059861]|uniref:WYL domain-containing protein n=1 Tax=Streptomyces sp. NPDC059861 TaxID=3346974 RepID=UPI0036582E70
MLHLDAPARYREPEPAPCLPLFVDALLTRRSVDVRHRRWRAPQEVRRPLRPYGLVLKSGVWYLVAAAEPRIATYRVTQVLDATLSDERFDRPQDFDLGAHWTSYLDEFQPRRYIGTATVRLSPRGRRRLPDNLPPEVVRAVESTATTVGDDGWIEAVIPTESTAHACGELLRLGVDVEVVAPAELRQGIAETVGVLAGTYGVT